ncbi:MAG: hypothetical protein KJ709_03065 [Nanoarchaeota archaeon]|nr:hypothetical protein [Nanoarchaeota archaeon]
MGMVEDAFRGLYPDREWDFIDAVRYSGRFRGYNANIQRRDRHLIVNMSKSWRKVSQEIRIGLIQSLLIKMFGGKAKTVQLDLYHNFLKNVHMAVPKTKTDSVLQGSFERLNERFFNGMMGVSNFVWGKGTTKLGHYDYGSDTISVSEVIRGEPELLDYVMYHEMLHKKHKFRTAGQKSYYHTRQFKADEEQYPGKERLERELGRALRKSKVKRRFRFW